MAARKFLISLTLKNGLTQAVVFDTLAYADLPLPALPADATKYLDGTGAWSVPPGTGGGGSLTSFSALCSADTSLSDSAWTDVTGCAISLLAGTYILLGGVLIRNDGAGTSTGGAKLYYGSTDLAAGEYSLGAVFNAAFAVTSVAVLASTQTVKLAGRSQSGASFTAKRYGDFDLGANSISGTYLHAIKIA